MGKKEAYVEELAAQPREWRSRIYELRARADKAKADVTLEHGEKIGELRARQEKVRNTLQGLKGTGEQSWEGINDSLEKMWTDLKNSLSGVLDQLNRLHRNRET